jgi:four helix bundle protein
MAHSHEDLDVWKHAMDLVDVIYTITKTIPPSERFGLISQMQRAAVSVPANIAEGCGRESTKDLLRLLAIAQGSLAELRTLLLIAERQSFIHRDQLGGILDRSNTVAKLLMGFRKSLRRKLDG